MDAKINTDYIRFTSDGINNNVEMIASSALVTFHGTTSGALVTLTNVKNPVNNQDVATKSYVDSQGGGSPGGTEGSVQYNSGSTFTGSLNFLFTGSTLYVTNITSGTLNTVISSISTLNVTIITAGILNVSGTSTLFNLTSTNLVATNISVGTLNVANPLTLTSLTVSNLFATSGSITNLVNISETSGSIKVTGVLDASSITTGTISVSGSSILQNVSTTVLNVTTITAGTLDVSGTSTLFNLTSTNLVATNGTISSLRISGTTGSISTSTGALVIAGGLGVGEKVYIGSTAVSTSVATGAVVISGGVGISGEVYASAYNTVSDSTHKENIKSLENSLEIINKINGVSYKWKNNIYGSKLQYGLIAQQLEEIGLESIVSGSTDGEKSVNYIALIPFLIESIKELSKSLNIK
jgi:hypothetical protein